MRPGQEKSVLPNASQRCSIRLRTPTRLADGFGRSSRPTCKTRIHPKIGGSPAPRPTDSEFSFSLLVLRFQSYQQDPVWVKQQVLPAKAAKQEQRRGPVREAEPFPWHEREQW